MNPWAKMASDLDHDDKIMAAGRNAREVFLYALRKNQLGDYGWVIPAGCMRPSILSRILMMSEEEACNGVTAAVTEGLLTVTDNGDYRIAAGDKWGGAKTGSAMSTRERVARHREKKKNKDRNVTVTTSNVTVTENVTVTAEEKRREERREEEEIRDMDSSPSAQATASPQEPLTLAMEPKETAQTRVPRKAPARPLAAEWKPTPAHEAMAANLGVSAILEADRMRDWAAANGERKADWDAAFRNWLRTAAQRGQVRDPPPPPRPRDPRVGYAPARSDSHTTPDGIVRIDMEL